MSDLNNNLLIFGEVLFDQFENGKQVLGGAPFNVAWHLQGFGLQPLFISRVGHDAQGEEILKTMSAWQMNTAGIQQDDSHPTGTVTVCIDQDVPSFTINTEQAYDYIEASPIKALVDQAEHPILYHGSLIQRNQTSKLSLNDLSQSLHATRFVDINLRPPWFSLADIHDTIAQAHWLKLNEEEYYQLTDEKNLTDTQLDNSLRRFFQRSHLELLIVTRAEKGAILLTQDELLKQRAPEVQHFVDAVGAGDGFSAVTLLGIIHQWHPQQILERALEFAAEICSHTGAVIEDRGVYESKRMAWRC